MKKNVALVGVLAALVLGIYLVRALAAPTGGFLSSPQAYDQEELERLIGEFEERKASGAGASDFAFLGDLYLRRSQLSYDVADIESARTNLEAAAATYPDVPVLINLAQANLGLHDFVAAARLATDVMAVDPTAFGAIAVAADAQLALGDYDLAGSNVALLGRHLPGDPAVIIRDAQHSFLTGDGQGAVDEALAAVRQARRAGLSAVDEAFYRMLAGRFLFETGHYDEAREQLDAAVELDPRRPGILYELGRVSAARGNLEESVDWLEQAATLLPEPTTLALLGDVLTALGLDEAADLQYDTITAIAALDQPAYRRSIAGAWAARGFEKGAALELAESEIMARPDPTTFDVYALALYQTGQLDKAFEATQQAIGPADSRIWYHAGLLSAAVGHDDEAAEYLQMALDLSPRFHPLEAETATAVLLQLDR